MLLKLNVDDGSKNFLNYLKKFNNVKPSLLMEIDPTNGLFTGKTFTEDRAAIRSSTLFFADANVSVESLEEPIGNKRIKWGILYYLPKVIKVIEQFNGNYSIFIKFNLLNNADGTADYVCESVVFKSDNLKINILGCRPSEFRYLSDDVFDNNIFKATDGFEIQITPEMIRSIINISSIVAVDPKKDILSWVYDSKTNLVSVKSDKSDSFEYTLGEASNHLPNSFDICVFREKFIQILKDSDEPFTCIIGKSSNNAYDRLLFDANETNTKLVVAAVVKES
jgi:hypothetical protein